jgi:hypothetical protein
LTKVVDVLPSNESDAAYSVFLKTQLPTLVVATGDWLAAAACAADIKELAEAVSAAVNSTVQIRMMVSSIGEIGSRSGGGSTLQRHGRVRAASNHRQIGRVRQN